MSPWGRWYLESFAYNPGWFEPFEGWRMSWGLEHVIKTWAPIGSPLWNKIADHLDRLACELQHTNFLIKINKV